MSPAEMRFRDVEALLDQKLSEARLRAVLSGVAMRDLSARHYHYKNQALSWSWQFVREKAIDGEIERISIFLTYIEPRGDSDALTVLVRSEVFRQGQISRIDRKHESSVTTDHVKAVGLEPLLKDAFEQGRKLLP